MAIDYSGNTVGDMAVAKNMQITNVNADDSDEGMEYTTGQSMAPIVKPVTSKMLGTVKGMAPSATLMTGNTGNR
jgi:hypothetical protein